MVDREQNIPHQETLPPTFFNKLNQVVDNVKRELRYNPSFRKGMLMTGIGVAVIVKVCSMLPPE